MTAPAPPSMAAAVAEELARMLRREAELGPGVVRFIDTTFANPSAAELARLLADESNPERDGLLELLFSPDDTHQAAIEPLLETAGGEVDEAEVARLLAAAVGGVRFRLPGGGETLDIALTSALAAGFVHKLAVGRRIPEALLSALRPIGADRDRLRAGVVLRHARLRFTPARIELLRRVIGRPATFDDAACDCLSFALEVLQSIDTEDGLWAFLSERKRRLLEALASAKRDAEQLSRAGFEVLQSRGRRLGFVDRAAAERELRFIDRVGLAVFGRLPHGAAERFEAVFDAADPQPD